MHLSSWPRPYPVRLTPIAAPDYYLTVAVLAQGVSSCHASDRVLVDTHSVTAGGYEFQVSTKACSADVLQFSSPSSRTLQKRTTFATCGFGGAFECIRNEGIVPLPADCLALNNAFIAAFIGPTRNCHLHCSLCTFLNPNIYVVPTLFTVPPQFVQEFSLGTCLWAWINENPNTVNGATLTECYGWLVRISLSSFFAEIDARSSPSSLHSISIAVVWFPVPRRDLSSPAASATLTLVPWTIPLSASV